MRSQRKEKLSEQNITSSQRKSETNDDKTENWQIISVRETSLVRPDPETQPNPTRTRPRPRFGCTRPKIYTRRVGRVLNSRPGSGSGYPPSRQVLGLACLPTRLYTRLTQFYTRYLHEY